MTTPGILEQRALSHMLSGGHEFPELLTCTSLQAAAAEGLDGNGSLGVPFQSLQRGMGREGTFKYVVY